MVNAPRIVGESTKRKTTALAKEVQKNRKSAISQVVVPDTKETSKGDRIERRTGRPLHVKLGESMLNKLHEMSWALPLQEGSPKTMPPYYLQKKDRNH